MFGQQTGLLLSNDIALALLFLRFELLLRSFCLALGLVNRQFLLPQALDFALVFQLTHAASLGIHLLQTIVLCKLLHQLALEFFFHALFFFSTLLLKSELVLTGSLKLLSDAHSLLRLSSLFGLSSFFALLHVKIVSELLLELLLGVALLLLGCESLKDLVADSFCLLFHCLDLVLTSLLLLSVPAHHLVFILIHLFLALEQCALFVLGQNHVSLGLLFLLIHDALLLVVFFNHALHHCVHLGLFLQVLVVSLLPKQVGIIDLLLDFFLVVLQLLQFMLVGLAFLQVTNLLVFKNRDVNGCILLLQSVKGEVRFSVQ